MDLFCGPNRSVFSNDHDEPSGHSECLVDWFMLLLHIVYILTIFPFLYCFYKNPGNYHLGSWHRESWPHYIVHNLRYIFTLFLIFFNILEVCEGVVSQSLYLHIQCHLFIPHCVGLIASCATLFYYHHVEVTNSWRFLLTLLVYWVLALSVKSWKVAVLFAKGLGIPHVRFDLTWDVIVVYFGLLVLEIIVLVKQCVQPAKVFEGISRTKFIHKFANFLSKATFFWITPILQLGNRKPLDISDLGQLPESEEAWGPYKRLSQTFMEQKVKSKDPSLVNCCFKVFWPMMTLGGFCKLVADLLQFVGPLAIERIIDFVEMGGTVINTSYSNTTVVEGNYYIGLGDVLSNGFVLCVLLALAGVLKNTFLHAHHFLVIRESMRCRSSLQSMVFEKALKLPVWLMSGVEISQGKIVNHMSTDAEQVQWALFFINYVWAIPMQLSITLFFLYQTLGMSALIGSAWLFVILPLQYILARVMTNVQKEKLVFTDERMKQANELVQSIKLVKLLSWTGILCQSVEKIRGREVRCLLKTAVLQSLSKFLTETGPVFILMTSFILYPYVQQEVLTSAKAITALAFIGMLHLPFNLFNMIVKMMVQGQVSCKRLQQFLMLPEVEQAAINDNDENLANEETKLLHANGDSAGLESETKLGGISPGFALEIKQGFFKWGSQVEDVCLKDIQLKIKWGSFTMIVGEVGCGKSSLLMAMLGEITTVSGMVEWSRKASVAYAAQTPWLLNATLKENILFGKPLDKQRYQEVIAACALQPDINLLVAGDETEIGERGINLSGGQKHRVSLARALYSDANVVIIDEPFSALDCHVGHHVFHEGVMALLKNRDKTVILVTHHVQFMSHADEIIVMSHGQITHHGNLEALERRNPNFLMSWPTPEDIQGSNSNTAGLETRYEFQGGIEEELEENILRASSGNLFTSLGTSLDNIPYVRSRQSVCLTKEPTPSPSHESDRGKLVTEEERETGHISLDVYLSYIKACSAVLFCSAILVCIAQHALLTGKDFWISIWSTASESIPSNSSHEVDLTYYIAGFTALSGSAVVLTFIGALLTVMAGFRAAKQLHHDLLRNIIQAPLRFFDTTPVGRILNRFSSDTYTIDERLPQTMLSLLQIALNLLSAAAVSVVATPFSLLALLVICGIYFILQRFFRSSSRELKRLESISKSPIYAQFSESLGGLSTIRAYRQGERFSKSIFEAIDSYNLTFLFMNTANRWLGIQLDYLGAFFTFSVALSSMIAGLHGHTTAGFVGIAIIYALSISNQLNWLVRYIADFEMNTNAVERVRHYTHIEREPRVLSRTKMDGDVTKDNKQAVSTLAADWPVTGSIEFQNTSLRYADTLPTVVNNLSAVIKGGAKIGICGRTGSGKSSITLGLFRMIDMCAGTILIDDLDIGSIPLEELRRRLSIIPQDPTLFIGTVRSNLDPFGENSDENLWHALDISQLKKVVKSLPGELDADVSEGGANFSVGQRQLFCLARAFLKHSKILVMDEATASIDLETDDLIQDVICRVFKHSTVLVVAHRLSTILNCDLLMVIQDGRLVEYDSPAALSKEKNSAFSRLMSSKLGASS